jgi:ATP-dependent DNA ligase
MSFLPSLISNEHSNTNNRYGPSFNDVILKNVKLKRCILDGEIIAWDNEVEAYVPFGHNRTYFLFCFI